jgi:hypothetical protein
MREIKAPSRPALERRIFLAGSIEMGQAEQWQQRIVDALSGAGDLVILNPRRDDWDDSWQQRADDPQFSEQVSWELDMLDVRASSRCAVPRGSGAAATWKWSASETGYPCSSPSMT